MSLTDLNRTPGANGRELRAPQIVAKIEFANGLDPEQITVLPPRYEDRSGTVVITGESGEEIRFPYQDAARDTLVLEKGFVNLDLTNGTVFSPTVANWVGKSKAQHRVDSVCELTNGDKILTSHHYVGISFYVNRDRPGAGVSRFHQVESQKIRNQSKTPEQAIDPVDSRAR